eukprot:401846_1
MSVRMLLHMIWLLCLISISNGAILTGTTTISSQNIDVTLSIDTNSNIVDITLIGPSNVYFAVGFGGSLMVNRYSIIVSGTNTVNEHKLMKADSTQSGTILSPQMITINSDTTNQLRRTVSMTRNRVRQNNNYYTFPNTAGDIDIIWAFGTSTSITQHGIAGSGTRDSTTISIAQATDIPTTIQPTTSLPTTVQPTTSQPTTYQPTTVQPTS